MIYLGDSAYLHGATWRAGNCARHHLRSVLKNAPSAFSEYCALQDPRHQLGGARMEQLRATLLFSLLLVFFLYERIHFMLCFEEKFISILLDSLNFFRS